MSSAMRGLMFVLLGAILGCCIGSALVLHDIQTEIKACARESRQ